MGVRIAEVAVVVGILIVRRFVFVVLLRGRIIVHLIVRIVVDLRGEGEFNIHALLVDMCVWSGGFVC
jgi:hypothetical protein